MDVNSISKFITATFEGSWIQEAAGDLFFTYGSDNRFPFATLVTKDNDYDNVSQLNREGIFRLSIGISKQNFQSLFPDTARHTGIGGYLESGLDFTATDTIMPHPIYGNMYWICVLSPSEATFQQLQPFLQEAYDMALERDRKTATKDPGQS